MEQTDEQVASIESVTALTCSIEEAANITGLSYDYLIGQSKIANPKDRLPGFKPGKSTFRVIVSQLPVWLDHKAELA